MVPLLRGSGVRRLHVCMVKDGAQPCDANLRARLVGAIHTRKTLEVSPPNFTIQALETDARLLCIVRKNMDEISGHITEHSQHHITCFTMYCC
jgi:hypothetical protein